MASDSQPQVEGPGLTHGGDPPIGLVRTCALRLASPRVSDSGGAQATSAARERILATASELFQMHGIRVIGIDRIISESKVAKRTLYRHFGSKDDLIVAVLERHQRLWHQNIGDPITEAHDDPAERLLAMFRALGDWFQQSTYDAAFNDAVLCEFRDQSSAVHQAARRNIDIVNDFIRRNADAAGVPNPADLAERWALLIGGVTVLAIQGNSDGAVLAEQVGRLQISDQLQRDL